MKIRKNIYKNGWIEKILYLKQDENFHNKNISEFFYNINLVLKN